MYKFQNQDGIVKENVANLVIQSSLKETNERFVNLILLSLGLGILVIVLFTIYASRIAKTISNPIRSLEKTAKQVISSLNFSNRVEIVGRDEVASLSSSFNKLLGEIEDNHEKLKDYSKNLEEKVEERTATIKMILDNVKSGFCLIDKKLVVEDGFTISCKDIVGDHFKSGEKLPDLLEMSQRDKEHFEVCLDQVFEDFMPESVTLSQSPNSVRLGDKTIGLSASIIRNKENEAEKLLYTINDVSELKEAQLTNERNQSLLKILQQKDAFLTFLVDAKQMLNDGKELLQGEVNNDSQVRIFLHTIKGNCAAIGLTEVAGLVHHIEDKEKICLKDINTVENAIRDFVRKNEVLDYDFDNLKEPDIKVSVSQLNRLREAIKQCSEVSAIKKQIGKWLNEVRMLPASAVFATVGDLVERVSQRLSKPVIFEFKGKDVMVDPEQLSGVVQTLPHVIRNCIDHGLEEPHERGKNLKKDM